MVFSTLEEALRTAALRAESTGTAQCVVSGKVRGVPGFAVVPLAGFGLPPGGTLENVVFPSRERELPDPPEKNSANGF